MDTQKTNLFEVNLRIIFLNRWTIISQIPLVKTFSYTVQLTHAICMPKLIMNARKMLTIDNHEKPKNKTHNAVDKIIGISHHSVDTVEYPNTFTQGQTT